MPFVGHAADGGEARAYSIGGARATGAVEGRAPLCCQDCLIIVTARTKTGEVSTHPKRGLPEMVTHKSQAAGSRREQMSTETVSESR